MRPTPPGPGYSPLPYPLRMPGPPPRMQGPPRLAPAGPAARLPPKMPPPPLPPPSHSRSAVGKQLSGQKKKHMMRNGITERAVDVRLRRNGPTSSRGVLPKMHKEQDFTVDTYEENLLTTSTSGQQRRPTRERYSQAK